MGFINLTPHSVIIGNIEVLPSGQVCRISEIQTPAGDHEDVPLVYVDYGVVENLPPYQPGILLVVSAMVRMAIPGRLDLASPGTLVRNDKGEIVGCLNLIVNRPNKAE